MVSVPKRGTGSILDKAPLTLSQFLSEIKATLDNKFKGDGYWVRGELSDWRQSGSHYYGELVEYDQNAYQSIAKARLSLWASNANRVIPKFHRATGEVLKSGMSVLLLVSVNFHTNYGFSLNIMDIDPSFTLGDREARKKKILTDLKAMGIIDKNKQIPMPCEFTKVAVISSNNAAGLGDFFAEANLLQKYGLCQFDVYEAAMQGKECPISVANQFRTLYKTLMDDKDQYDAIVLIRGGGSETDLDWFNYEPPAKAICHMPIPVFVGIGHERDRTVLDEVACQSFDTPSKVIGYIANKITSNAQGALDHYRQSKTIAASVIHNGKERIKSQRNTINGFTSQVIQSQGQFIQSIYKGIRTHAGQQAKIHHQSINNNMGLSVNSAKALQESLKLRLAAMVNTTSINTKVIADKHQTQITQWANISTMAKATINSARSQAEQHYKGILGMSIEPTLQRGFTLTQSDGKYITCAKQAKACKSLTIKYHNGDIQTEVTQ